MNLSELQYLKVDSTKVVKESKPRKERKPRKQEEEEDLTGWKKQMSLEDFIKKEQRKNHK